MRSLRCIFGVSSMNLPDPSTARPAAIVLACCVAGFVGSAAAAPTSGVAVLPFRGPGGRTCARQVAQSLARELTIMPMAVRETPRARIYPTLAKWLKERRREGVGFWVLGTMAGTKVILEAYDASSGVLLGLEQFRPRWRHGCRLPGRMQRRLVDWLTRGPARSGLPGPAPPPLVPVGPAPAATDP